ASLNHFTVPVVRIAACSCQVESEPVVPCVPTTLCREPSLTAGGGGTYRRNRDVQQDGGPARTPSPREGSGTCRTSCRMCLSLGENVHTEQHLCTPRNPQAASGKVAGSFPGAGLPRCSRRRSRMASTRQAWI